MVLPSLSYEEIEFEAVHENESRQRSVITCTIALLILCYLAVALRLVSRRLQGLRLAWNDYTIIFAVAVATAMSGVILYAVKLGLGLHVILVGATKGFEVAKFLYLTEVLFPACNHAVKISILLLYHAIFGDTRHRWFNLSLRLLICMWLLCTFISIFCIALQCVPVSLAWTSDHSHGCLNLEQMIMGLTIWSVILNFATLILPMPIIWELKLSVKTKISVAFLFVLGGADVIVCIIRAAETKDIDPTLVDFTWIQAPSAMLGLMEPTIGIICACIPTWRPLFRMFRSGLSTKNSSTRGKTTSRTGHSAWTVPFIMMMTSRNKTGNRTENTYGLDQTFGFEELPSDDKKLPPYIPLVEASRVKIVEKNLTLDTTSTTLSNRSSEPCSSLSGSKTLSGTGSPYRKDSKNLSPTREVDAIHLQSPAEKPALTTRQQYGRASPSELSPVSDRSGSTLIGSPARAVDRSSWRNVAATANEFNAAIAAASDSSTPFMSRNQSPFNVSPPRQVRHPARGGSVSSSNEARLQGPGHIYGQLRSPGNARNPQSIVPFPSGPPSPTRQRPSPSPTRQRPPMLDVRRSPSISTIESSESGGSREKPLPPTPRLSMA